MIKKYKVTADVPIMDHQPGDVFEADLQPAFEQRRLKSGSLEVVGGSSTHTHATKSTDETDDQEES